MLDLGCGPGVPSTRALARRFDVFGVDISEAQIQAAQRQVAEATFIHADLVDFEVPDASIDGVAAFYSIIHLPREQHVPLFAEVARWLKPGGLFLASLGVDDDAGWTGDWLGVPMFFSSFDAPMNRALLEAAGFTLLVSDVVEMNEPEGPISFLWIIAQTR